MAVVETGSLLSFSITSSVHLTRMGSLAGFLDNSKSMLGIAAGLGTLAGFLDNSKSLLDIAAGLGSARHFRVPVRTRS